MDRVDERSLRVVRSNSIHEIPEELWDSVNAQIDLYHTHRFIRSVEDGARGEVRFWYLRFYQADRLVGTAALSSFVVHLDLFLGSGSRRVINALRRIVPSFMLLRSLFCGLPVSLGKHTVAVAPGADHRIVLRRLVEEMVHIARREKIRILCVKEFMEEDRAAMDELCSERFMPAMSLPYARLRLRWGSFDAYLGEMRHGYRRPIVRSLRKIDMKGGDPGKEPYGPAAVRAPRLIVGGTEVCAAATFHRLYLEVMRRAEARLEILSRNFFEHLYANMAEDLVVVAIVRGEVVLGAALCAVEGSRMTFLLVGLDYAARDDHDVYFNLVYGIVRSAIERGCRTLDLGQTSYWLKSRIGAETTPQCFYLRSENRALHGMLRLLRPLLFPGAAPPHPSVMKQPTATAPVLASG